LHHLYLHSFPTRRSSDLLEAYYPISKQNGYEDLYGDFERLLGNVKVMNNQIDEALTYFNKSIQSYEVVDDKQHLSMTYKSIAKRSEEHTSELQSQSNLVC